MCFALISTRGMKLDNLLSPFPFSFTSVFEVFCITSNLGVSGFKYRIFLIFESSQLNEFSTDLLHSGL